MPKFSVIIPTYNEASYLPQALESVLAQTFKDFEVVVVDDGSTDETRFIVEQFAPSVQYVYQKNQGAYAARNTGIRLAKGELIAFLDSDDVWFPDTLERQNRYLAAHPEVGMLHGYIDTMDQEARPLPKHSAQGRKLFKRLNEKGVTYESIILDCAFHFDTCVLRKSSLETIGEFDEHIPVCEDFDFLLRVAAKVKIGFLAGNSLATWRLHANGFGFIVFNEGKIDVLKRHLALVESKALSVNYPTAARNIRLSLSNISFVLGDKPNGRKYFLSAVIRNPSALLLLSHVRVFVFSFLPDSLKKIFRSLLIPHPKNLL